MQKISRVTILLFVLNLFNLLGHAQYITNYAYQMGLMDKDKTILLTNTYRSVELISTFDSIYLCHTGQDLYGLYLYKTKTLIPCVYDEIIDKNGIYILKQNKKYGWFISDSYYRQKQLAIIEPQYDEVKISSYDYITVRKNNLWGVFNRDENSSVRVPVEYPYPIEYESNRDFYCRLQNDTILMLMRSNTPGKCNPIKVTGKSVHSDERFVYYNTYHPQVLHIHDILSGKELLSLPSNDSTKTYYDYNSYWLCVVEKKIVSKRKRILTLINPYSSERIYSRLLKQKEELRLNGFVTTRNLGSPAKVLIYTHSGDMSIELFEGEITNYTYKPYDKPYVETGSYSGGNGKKPFFMPGE